MFNIYFTTHSINRSGVNRREICLREARLRWVFKFTKISTQFFSITKLLRFPKVAEIAWLETGQRNATSSFSSILKNIQAILISRFQSADFIADSSKQKAIDKIKNLKNLEIALNDDILPKILKTSKVMNLHI